MSFVLCIVLVWVFASPAETPHDRFTAYAQTLDGIEQEISDLAREIADLEQQASDYQAQVDSFEQEKDALADEQAALEAKRQETADSLEEQQAQSALLQQQIEKKGEEIALNLEMIATLEQQIAEKNAAIELQKATIIALEQQHEDQFRLLQKRLRSISQSNTSVSVLQLLFNSESYIDYLLSFKLSERISENDQRIMDSLEEIAVNTAQLKAQNEADVLLREQELADLERIQTENEAARAELEGYYAESEALALQMEQDMSYLNEQINEIDQKQSTLESEIAKALEAQRQREEEQRQREEEQKRLEEEQERLEEEQKRQEEEQKRQEEEQKRQEEGAQQPEGDNSTDSGNNDPDEDTSSDGDEDDDPDSDSSYIQGVDGGMYWPTPTCTVITSSYKYRPQFGRWHYGIDIACYGSAMGRLIVPAATGTVIYSGWMSGYGYCLMIDHGYDSNGNHILTLYGHCNALYAEVGDYVIGGQTHIADVGNSGVSYGAHLHFEVRVNNSAVDPVSNGYLSTAGIDILG